MKNTTMIEVSGEVVRVHRNSNNGNGDETVPMSLIGQRFHAQRSALIAFKAGDLAAAVDLQNEANLLTVKLAQEAAYHFTKKIESSVYQLNSKQTISQAETPDAMRVEASPAGWDKV